MLIKLKKDCKLECWSGLEDKFVKFKKGMEFEMDEEIEGYYVCNDDFYGVVFEGHPNLKRILNVDEMIIFPMRKEYPLEDQTREDKNDSMFGR